MNVLLTSSLGNLTNNHLDIELNLFKETDINLLINLVNDLYPGFSDKLFVNGKLNKFINVYLNDEDIRFLQNEKTLVNDNDVVSFIPAIAGG